MTPTRTALVLALTAAALAFGAPAASAEECGFADPGVPGGWVATDCFTNDPEGQRIPDEVQEQMPEETTDRQIDCPDGSVGRVQGDMVICPAPTVQSPAAESTAPVQDRIAEHAADQRSDAAVTVDTAPGTATATTAPSAAAPTAVPAETSAAAVTITPRTAAASAAPTEVPSGTGTGSTGGLIAVSLGGVALIGAGGTWAFRRLSR